MKSGTQKLFLILLTIATAVYLVWRLGWTIPLDHGVVDIGFVHGLHKDSALKTNLIFIIIRSLKRKYFKKGNRV